MTSFWSKGRSKRHPCYLCDTRGHARNRGSIPRERIDSGFAEIMQSLQATGQVSGVAKAMLKDAWGMPT